MTPRAQKLRRAALSVSGALAWSASSGAALSASPGYDFDLPAEPLHQALREVALAVHQPLAASSVLLAGRRAPPLKGHFTAEAAYRTLLSGSGLRLVAVAGGFTVISGEPPLAPPPSIAATSADLPAAPASPTSLPEVTVTGTRIRGQGPVGSELITVDRSALQDSGYATAQEMLRALPQDFGGGPGEATADVTARNGAAQNTSFGSGVNLRGLGPDSTLVLINGQRPALGGPGGLFADTSLIPSVALDRIEVLADGASAIYGSDAVAGVVNFIFRDRFQGAETTLRYGSADGDFGETQISQIWGGGWRTPFGDGHAVVAYEYDDRGALAASQRPFASEDLRAIGGPDLRSIYASPATLMAGGVSYALPPGDGVGLNASTLKPGSENLQDNREDTDILPQQRRHSFYLSLHQDLGADTTLYGQVLYSGRSFAARTIPVSQTPLSVPFSNPFYINPLPGKAAVQVDYSFLGDLGPQDAHGLVQGYDATIGLNRRLGSWSADLHGGFGEDREYSRTDNVPNLAELAIVLADPNPATAYNVFGGAGSTSAATRQAVRGYFADLSHATVWTAAAKAEGPLFSLPAGQLRLASGLEFRREAYDYTSVNDYLHLTPSVAALPGLPRPRNIVAAYGEIAAPLVSEAMATPLVRRLELSLAGRVEHYSDVGLTANPKVGLVWSPQRSLALRAAFGTSFRAPSFNELRQGPGEQLYAPVPLPDPRAASGVTDALVLLGNAPNLKPERAQTWNAGFDFAPPSWSGFKVTVSYFDVVFNNRIAAPNPDTFTFLENRNLYTGVIDSHPSAAYIASLYASPYFSNPYALDAATITTVIDGRVQNLSRVHQDGLDFDIGQSLPLFGAAAAIGLSGSYTLHVDQAITPGAPTTDLVGQIGYPVRLRWRGRASLAKGPVQLNGFLNYTGRYLNTTTTPAERVDAFTTLDLQLSYSFDRPDGRQGWLQGVRLAASVSNALNAGPPYALVNNGVSAAGYDPEEASPVGRVVSLQLVKRW